MERAPHRASNSRRHPSFDGMPGNNGEGHYFNQEIEMAKLPLSDIEVLTSRGFSRGPEPRSIWPISGRR